MSRSKTPNPAQDGNNYDQNLLVDAPEASRAQLREGYDVDLLESRPPQRSQSVRISPMGAATPAPPPPVPQVPLVLAGAGNGSKEQFVGAYASKPPTGFWRSRNGIITAIVIILVVIGAVVGGAVGATTKKTLSHSSAAPDDGTAPVASATSTTGSSTSASSSVHP
ncbi:hypothetical protein EDD15DRAFT_933345 [Pisolithus albus]|nr:hypothetical protein EDD15DRAFT_1119951 [Pisolithus albus]KAI5993313.1 hypothetical protein EDD15DRAFT_933345 [Pisolithus albus]